MPKKPEIKYGNISALFFLLIISFAQFYWLHSVNDISLKPSLTDAFISTIFLYIVFLCINYIPDFNPAKNFDYFYSALYIFILALLWVYFCQYIFTYIFSNDAGYVLFWKKNLFIRGFIAWIIFYNFKIVAYLKDKFYSNDDLAREEKQIQQLRNDAELFKLRQQLQPHFLFNSLNSVNALIGRQPQQARQMLQQLSDYLRNTIKKEDDNFISFKEEMDDLRLYLAIEQVRFGHRLNVEENVEADCEQIKIPPFLLQPLVENAIKYGLYGTTETVIISITVNKINNELIFIITNPYDVDAVATKSTGFGLDSIRRRLYLLFTRNDLLKIEQGIKPAESTNNAGLHTFIATLIIPLEKS